MQLRRVRVWLALLIAAAMFVLALVPILMWRSQRADAIRAELDAQLVAQMEEVQTEFILGEPETNHPSWNVNIREGWTEPYSETDLEPPLFTWLRETGTSPSFRSYTLDAETNLRGYVLPTSPDQGFVTLADTQGRDDRLGGLTTRTMLFVLLSLLLAAAAGWLIAGFALAPTRRAIAAQQGFLADAAHEMRTPLAVITASSSQALARPRAEEDYVRSLSEIRSAAERASSGVNELLDLVRFDSGQAIPRLAPLRLDLLAEEVAASVRDDDCTVVAEPTKAVVVNADMALLRQAIDNLVRNAVRRSERVELRTTTVEREGMIEVVDDGEGFDPAVLPDVFDRFQRGDRRGEVGVGLAIVKAIVTAHGGVVTARNGEDGGAIVTVRIPLADLP